MNKVEGKVCSHKWMFAERNSYNQVFICTLMCGARKFVREYDI